jgi:hypothetical protein
MTEDRDSWLELLPIHDADVTIWEVVVACPECGMRQSFRGTGQEIGDAAEVWQKGHRREAHPGERDRAAPKNGKDLKLPGVNYVARRGDPRGKRETNRTGNSGNPSQG